MATNAAAAEVIEITDSDAEKPSPSPSPSQEQARVAAILAAADRSLSAVSSVRDEPHPALSQSNPDESTTTAQRALKQDATNPAPTDRSTANPHPEQPPARLPRDLMTTLAYGPPIPLPPLPPRRPITIPGGLATEQLHLPPSERKPQTHLDRMFRNILEYGSLNGPEERRLNDPGLIPSRREMLERSKRERLEREAERDRKVREEEEREREFEEGIKGRREERRRGLKEREREEREKEEEAKRLEREEIEGGNEMEQKDREGDGKEIEVEDEEEVEEEEGKEEDKESGKSKRARRRWRAAQRKKEKEKEREEEEREGGGRQG